MRTFAFERNRIENSFSFSKLLVLILSLSLLGCSSDDSEDEPENFTANFRFEFTGSINKVIEGQGIFFNQTTTDGVTFEGDDTKLTTVLFVAQARDTQEEVAFAITSEGTDIGTGNFQIGFDLESFYNAFLNYLEDKSAGITYQSSGGSIRITSKSSGFVSGTVNVDCESSVGDGSININGTFTAQSAN